MNTLSVKAKHKGFCKASVEKFSTIIDFSTITISTRQDQLELEIKTRRKEPAALILFFDVYTLLFIYLGAFPSLESVEFNGNIIDTSQWVRKYTTRPDLFRYDLFITELSNKTINQDCIDAFRRLQRTAVYSFQYLTSKEYMHVVSDHRITLLFHVIDGICEIDKTMTDTLFSEILRRYKPSVSKKELGQYLPKVYAISKECFFYYHRKYNCEILRLLKISQYTFLRVITDTRNWNSHFLRNKKPDRLKSGTEIAIFIELVQYMIRLKITKDIGAAIDEDHVKEYYYTVHDWILKVLYDKADNLKSKTYITNKQWDDFIKQMNQHVIESNQV